MIKTNILTIFIVFLLALGGCGYSSSSLLPPELDSINVQNFENSITTTREVSNRRPTYNYWPDLENEVTRAVIDGFIFDRHLDIKNESKSAMILEGELVDFRLLPLSYDKGEDVDEFRVEIYVNLRLINNLTGKLMWKESSFMGWSSYTTSGPNATSEAVAVKKAVKDLSQRIVERVVEDW